MWQVGPEVTEFTEGREEGGGEGGRTSGGQ